MIRISIAAALALVLAPVGQAQAEKLKVTLSGYQEVPASLASAGSGEFEAEIREERDGPRIVWQLSYNGGFSSPVTQAHIHFGQRHTNGGISIFLCSNLPNPPAGTQACPPGPATIEGEAAATNVIGPATQLIPAGDIEKVIAAIRAGVAYVNIHTVTFPGGEVRGQFADNAGAGHRH